MFDIVVFKTINSKLNDNISYLMNFIGSFLCMDSEIYEAF